MSNVFDLLDKLKNNSEVIKTIKQIENIFQLKKEFLVYLDMSMNKLGIADVKRYGFFYWADSKDLTLKIFGYIIKYMIIINKQKSLQLVQAFEFENNRYFINLYKLLIILFS
ncbi:hypothetical protein [Mycoplasma sp. VS1572C]